MTRIAAIAVCVGLAGCALIQPSPRGKEPVVLRPGEIASAHKGQEALAIGQSTKAEVRAALGEAVVVDFDSGYEVWVYRERPREKAPPPAELVLLFGSSGVLAKARMR